MMEHPARLSSPSFFLYRAPTCSSSCMCGLHAYMYDCARARTPSLFLSSVMIVPTVREISRTQTYFQREFNASTTNVIRLRRYRTCYVTGHHLFVVKVISLLIFFIVDL